MKIEIRSWLSGGVLFEGEFGSIKLAIQAAIQKSANLGGADLRSANLRSANLGGADLRSANLGGANLRSANLRSALGVAPELSTQILMLLDQPPKAKMRAYKLVNASNGSPIHTSKTIIYEIGKSYEIKDAEKSPEIECGPGINVATLDWCLRNWQQGYKILIVEFRREDIAAVPNASDGKFRIFRCKVIGEKKLDYKKIFNLKD